MGNYSRGEKAGTGSLAAAVILNLVITIAQFTGGIISGSLALISDAVHNLSDSLSIVLAWIAQWLGMRPVTRKSTFGYKRAEILAAFINALVLFGVSVYLVTEAVERFMHPREINYQWMLWLGLLGIVANGLSVFLLRNERGRNINIRTAYLHLLGDALTSVAVVAGALMIKYFGEYWIDPVITILISIYLFVQTLRVFREATGILMQMVPSTIDVEAVKASVSGIAGVSEIHHIHLWRLSDEKIHFECHVDLKDNLPISDTEPILAEIEKRLKEQFQIGHLTIQFEFNPDHEQSCEY